ncbi:MAG: sugar phosphate isomerase/epimerase [Eubacteriales bacterium]|nr:sugar phosphate isomerase/epimerase [Eubacteriales bacterium]
MYHFSIGVMNDSFRLPLREGLKKAAELGAQGVQMYAISGEMAPENLGPQQRRDLLHYMQDLGLVASALCADLGGHAFTRAQENPGKIERSKRIIDLALDLDCCVATTHIGVIPEDFASEHYAVMASACEELGAYANAAGAKFAIETGPEPAKRMRRFLDSLRCGGGMAVNFDPANLRMVIGEEAGPAIHELAPYIVHIHAKDGSMLKKTDPEIIYDFFAEGGIGDMRIEDYFIEQPLGEGQVDWDGFFAALKDIEYNGFLTIEREVGADPAGDIAKAIAFLKARV